MNTNQRRIPIELLQTDKDKVYNYLLQLCSKQTMHDVGCLDKRMFEGFIESTFYVRIFRDYNNNTYSIQAFKQMKHVTVLKDKMMANNELDTQLEILDKVIDLYSRGEIKLRTHD